MSTTAVLLRRTATVPAPEPSHAAEAAVDPALVVAGVANLWALGFAPSAELVRAWMGAEPVSGVRSITETVEAATVMVGAHRVLEPFYPNFPRQVAEASDVELFVNALMHYTGDLFGVRIVPVYEKKARARLRYAPPARHIGLAAEDAEEVLVKSLVHSAASLSPADVDDLAALVRSDIALLRDAFASPIRNRENLAHITGLWLDAGVRLDPALEAQYATATDVLRLAAAMSDGDVSLASPTRFAAFSRARRRTLLGLLDRVDDSTMDARPGAFTRLGERLHPGEMASAYPRAAAAFARVRSGKRAETVLTRTEAALVEGETAAAAVELAEQRPGELARRLDHLLRRNPSQAGTVLDAFARSASGVSTPVLLAVGAHFRARAFSAGRGRLVMPKAMTSRARLLPDTRTALPAGAAGRVVETVAEVLASRFASLPPLGKVWVDPALSRAAVPLQVRNAAPGLRTLGRGSRLALGEGAIQRAFMWWCDNEGERVDLDLSMMLLDETMENTQDVAYYNLRELGCTHSGDFTSAPAPEGAAEFVDVDVEKLRSQGWVYAAVVVTSYTGQSLSTLAGAFAGVMGRASGQDGEVFEPSTVHTRLDLVADSRIVVPMVLDLARREMVWADLSLPAAPYSLLNVAGNRVSLTALLSGVVAMRPPSLGELFAAHVAGRGTPVTERSQADLAITCGEGPAADTFDGLDTAAVLSQWVV